MSTDYISLSRQAKAFFDELPPNPDDAPRQVTPPHMSQYPPPSETETVAYSTPSYPPAVPNQDTSNYTTPGNPIDPSLANAQPIQEDSAHQALQQLQDAALQEAALSSQAASQAAAAAAAAQQAKQRRVAQACDNCSSRKVKCDEGNPCKNCTDLDVPCTRIRQRKRRGPPNRVKERIEAEKRARSANDLDISTAVALGASTQSFGPGSQSSTDLIAPPDIIQQLLAGFFTYVYPAHPFPHEPWLMQAFNRRADIGDDVYNPVLALISSMIALLAALRPHQTFTLVSSLGYENIDVFIQRARSICISARGLGFLERDDLDSNAAATSYFMAILSSRVDHWFQYRSYLAEAIEIIRQAVQPDQHIWQDELQIQMGCRILWSIHSLTHSVDHLNGAQPKSHVNFDPFLAKPALADDESISPDKIHEGQSKNFGPLMLALDTLIQIHSTEDQITAKHPLKSELIEAAKQLRESVAGWHPLTFQLVNSSYQERFNGSNRAIRYEIQRANLLTSHLLVRLSLLDMSLKAPLESEDLDTARSIMVQMAIELEQIAKGLLYLFKDMSHHTIEGDARTFLETTRKIMTFLFSNDETIATGPYSHPLQRFEELLGNLIAAKDDAEEFHYSSDLKLYQDEFAKTPVGASLTQFQG